MGRHRKNVHGSNLVTTCARTVTRVETKDRVVTVTRSETRFETKPKQPPARPKSRWGGGFAALPPPRGSRGEKDVEHALHDNGVGYIREKTFDGLVGLGGGSLRYDFAVPVVGGAQKGPSPVEKHFLLIEYDGRQHFKPTKWGRSMTMKEAEKCFEKLQKHDGMKNDYARSRGYPLLRIPHYKSREIRPMVRGFLRQHGLTTDD